MNLLSFIKGKKEPVILVIHVLLGGLSLVSVYFFVIWFYFILVANVGGLTKSITRSKTILLLCGYFFGLELIGRMIKAAPLVPYQVGNYFMLGILSYGILSTLSTRLNLAGISILLLCIPGFYMIPYSNYLTYFLNSFSGILSLGLAAVYFGNQTYTFEDLTDFIKVTVLPIIAILVYISVKSPSYDDIDFELSANFETTGGFGSNQISTVLGAGTCLLLVAYLKKEKIFYSFSFLSILLIVAFLFRSLLTFSRGGVIGGLLAALFSYLYLSWKVNRKLGSAIFKLIGVAAGIYLLFLFSNNITGGTLLQRYQGETAGTLSGSRDKDLKVLTSNRSSLAEIELKIFYENIFLGVGPGKGYELREKYFGSKIASHTEITRLLAEQGIPGLLIVTIFLFYPVLRIAKSTSSDETYFIIAFFLLAIITSFHAGMRTMLTPLFWGLSCARFQFAKQNHNAYLIGLSNIEKPF